MQTCPLRKSAIDKATSQKVRLMGGDAAEMARALDVAYR